MKRILVVDDEKGVCYSFKKILGRHGYDVITALSGMEAIEKAVEDPPDLVILDISMPDLDGLEALRRLKATNPCLTVIMMTAYNTPERAITAMKYGAYDYITKPFDNDQLISLVNKAIMAGNMSSPVALKEDDDTPAQDVDRIVGKSRVMLDIYKKIGQVAESDATVLLTGETGTGKELIARAIYQHSRRVNKPFLPVNCAAIPETLLESELFGHEKGAFTGANARRIGKFEQCNGGTMFLDEVGDMPLSLQAKLLRVLQDGHFQRVGGSELIKSDVRIIAATNKDLETLVSKGRFREDLYWRLNVINIKVPPLRERKDDIDLLIQYFIQRYNKELGREIKGISKETLRMFRNYHWPGNVRQLQSIIYRAMILSKGDIISFSEAEWLAQTRLKEKDSDIEKELSDAISKLLHSGEVDIYRKAVSMFEGLLVRKALELTGNNQAMAARLLGISRNTLRDKMGPPEEGAQ
jgi:nitrogen regulation protein NR(I)